MVGAAPASAGYRVGVGEQNQQMFDSPSWQSLKLKRVRYLVPWDYANHVDQRNEVDHYMLRARAARQDVLVTFTARRGCYLPSGRYSKAKVCRAPSASAYRNAFGMFDAKFPWVKTYSAWNEINHKSQPTFKSPRTAAGYYNVLRAQARKGKFRVMAADMLDTPNMGRYLATFRRYAKGSAEAMGPAQLRRRQPPPHDLHQADAAHRPRRGLADRDRRHRQAAAELQALRVARRRAHEGHVPARRRLRHAPARHALEDHAAVRVLVLRRRPHRALRRRPGEPGRHTAQGVLRLLQERAERTARSERTVR